MAADGVLVVDYVPDNAAPERRVTSSVPPRVAVLEAGADDLPDIAPYARFAMARTAVGAVDAVGDEAVLDELDEGARLFVNAWRTRPLDKPERLGEGHSWGATGFEPPDPPAGWVDPSRRQGEG